MILTFDADGVIVECVDGVDNNPEARNIESYSKKGLCKGFDVELFNDLIATNVVYVVSARSYPGASQSLMDWLWKHDVTTHWLQGVLCAEGTREGRGSDTKHEIIQWLGSDLHIEDHPDIVRRLRNRAILMPNPLYPDNTRAWEAENTEYYKARNLAEVVRIIERTKQTRRLN